MMNGAVILNYNSSILSYGLAKKLASYKLFKKIVIVDNNSCFDQKEILKNAPSLEKIKIIYSDTNSGYAAGNNIGLQYLIYAEKCDICFIVNPDIIVEERTCDRISETLANFTEYGVVSSLRTDINGKKTQRQFWNAPTYRDCIKECFWFFRRRYMKHYVYDVKTSEQPTKVEVIPGSFFGIRSDVCKEIDFLDEETFLYNEENCLAQKLFLYGYQEAIVTDVSYIHNHVKPSVRTNPITVYKRGYQSKKHYIYKYIIPRVPRIKGWLLKFLYAYSYCERMLIYTILKK